MTEEQIISDLMWLSVEDIPHTLGGYSRLYCDYLINFPKVQQYYETDFHLYESSSRQPQNYGQRAEQISSKFPYRSELVEILTDQNKNFGATDKTFEHIQLLADSKTLAIVTGQQVGMFSGPLYTLYKTITTIKLAAHLKTVLPDFNFVPIFWLEGEDHDFQEMNYIRLLNAEHKPTDIIYQHDEKALEKNLGAVGELVFNSTLSQFFEQVQKTMSNSEFKAKVLTLFQEIYQQGTSFNKAFASLMNKLFPDAGLIFVSSNDKKFKRLLAPIFKQEIETVPQTSQLIIEKSAELETKYHAQIKPKALNLFLFHKGGRYLIEPRENDFSLKGVRQYFQKDELLKLVEETPEVFSPNVALRPICQDTILPTLCYVAGPSEIAYFAQLKPVYTFFNLTMPIIYPRASATILETNQEKILEKYQLELTELFQHPEKSQRKVIDLVSEVNIDELFANAKKRTDEMMNEMKFGLNHIDPTLLGALETTRSKVESQLDILREKTVEAQKKRHEVALRQINKVTNSLLPNGNLQERELNVLHFLNKHGFDFINHLQSEIQIDKFMHQVIRI
jgi:bacillithiol biosynthesis cysteine-adding enzyme BshC